jgi:signal transduction histidine kinase
MTIKHLKPIHDMNEQVRQISTQNLDTRLDIRGTKDELKDLAYTFNSMLDGISHSYQREKQFVSDASHELRTPIAVIKGYAALLKRWGKDDPDVLEESIDAIVGEVEGMQSLVESLLFIARQERGTLEMEFASFSLSSLMNEIAKDTELIDESHKLIFDIKPKVVQFGSEDKLKQALRILVDNSIKYTPDGGIIQVELKETEKQNVITVSDTGIGIKKEDIPHVFDRFYRADKSRTKLDQNKQGGTGLGLSIAKIIIEQHHGRVLVESEVNVGTKFSIFLPKKFDPEKEDKK